MADPILTATTSAANTKIITVSQNEVVTIQVTGIQVAAEYIDFAVSTDGGSTFADLYQDGTQIRLSSTNTTRTVVGPLMFRLEKEATTNAVGLVKFGG